MPSLYLLCDFWEPSLSRIVLEARRKSNHTLHVIHVTPNDLSLKLKGVLITIRDTDSALISVLNITDTELSKTGKLLKELPVKGLAAIRACGSRYHREIQTWAIDSGLQYEDNQLETARDVSTKSEYDENEVTISERRWIQYRLMRALIAGEPPETSFEDILLQLQHRKISKHEIQQAQRFFDLGEPDMAGGSYAEERQHNPNAIDRLRDRAVKIARSGLNTLIVGETGTGKESVAWYFHDFSSRKYKLFLALNCAFFEGDRLESELFGHEQGSFTDAKKAKKGLVEEADGGTIFLDELPEMAPRVQAKLLRFLQDGTFTRLGGIKVLRSDVRIISAAQPRLLNQIRADLYHRIADVELHTTPLRQMTPQAIVNIACNLAYRLMWKAVQCEKGERVLTPDVIRAVWAELALPEKSKILSGYSWPGNMRELSSAIKRYVLLGDNIFDELRVSSADFSVRDGEVLRPFGIDEEWKQFIQPVTNLDSIKNLKIKLNQLQAAYLRNLIANLGGREKVSLTKLAATLDCSYNTLRKHLG